MSRKLSDTKYARPSLRKENIFHAGSPQLKFEKGIKKVFFSLEKKENPKI